MFLQHLFGLYQLFKLDSNALSTLIQIVWKMGLAFVQMPRLTCCFCLEKIICRCFPECILVKTCLKMMSIDNITMVISALLCLLFSLKSPYNAF